MIHLPPMLSTASFARRLALLKDARALGYGWLDALRVSGHPAMQGGVVTLGGRVAISVNITDDRTFVTGAGAQASRQVTGVEAAWLIASGIAAGQGDKCWGDTVTALTGATTVHDLATGGNCTDAAGAPVVFLKLRALILAATGVAGVPNTTTVQLVRPTNGVAWLPGTAPLSVAPLSAGGMFVWCDPGAGVPVTAATFDLIHVVNTSGASAGYTIIFVGTSA